MVIKVEKFLLKQGNRVGKAAVEFTDGPLKGFHLVGFTICDDPAKGGLFVLFPATTAGGKKDKDGNKVEKERPYFFLRPERPELLDDLQTLILDEFEGIGKFNTPKMVRASKVVETVSDIVGEVAGV